MPGIYVALDLETTGLDPEHDAITEIGAVKFRGEQVLDTFQNLVNPGRPIPFKIQQLTGITNEMVRTAPALSSVLPGLRRVVGNYPVIGHNIGFDLSFLRRHGLFQKNPAIDTFELASILLPYADRYSLGKLAEELNISLPASHRALDDARVTHALFIELLDQATRLNLSVIQSVNRLAEDSDWSLRSVFADLESMRSRTVFTSSMGQQLAAKGVLSLEEGGRSLMGGTGDVEDGPFLQPETTTRLLDVDQLAAMLEDDGLFARKMPSFEHRREQVAMLRQVAEAFNTSDDLMIEAGTGVGKSIAYLLPAIYWAVQNGQRVVIATHTINLQDQLLKKDIPDIQRILPLEFRAVALKGRSNYVCPHRVRLFQAQIENRKQAGRSKQEAASDLELRVLAKVLVWLSTTVSGDKRDLFLPNAAENAIWTRLCSDAEMCTSDRCRHENCFLYRAKKAAERAHVVVVNHALLLADAAADNRILPEYQYLIIDEAHHLEDSVTQQLSFNATQLSLERMLNDLSDRVGLHRYVGLFNTVIVNCRGNLPKAVFTQLEEMVTEGHEIVDRTRRSLSEFFNALSNFLSEHGPRGNHQYDRRLRLTSGIRRQPAWDQVEISWDNLSANLESIQQVLHELIERLEVLIESHTIPDFEDLCSELHTSAAQVDTTHEQIRAIIQSPQDHQADPVTWIRVDSRNGDVSLHAAPLHIGDMVQRYLFNAKQSVVLTSATLRTEENSDFIRERLGAQEINEAAVGSPFDYQDSTLLYLPTDIPEPNRPNFQQPFENALIDLAQAIRGRTLVLFTSYSHLKNTANAVRQRLAEDDIEVLEQGGGGSRAQLLEHFKSSDGCVLLGTRSFWEGIDVAGKRLSCVAIVKLPFSVPDDPIFAARSEMYDDGFYHYSLPETILRFRQGFGRLIRTHTDRGVVVCFDRRILSRRYGEAFLRSLPACTSRRGPLDDLPQTAARWINESRI